MRYLIYCMENAIMNLKPGKEQMVWLIDFQKWNMSSISVKVTRETANVLQNRYPERLGLAILYNPPKVFESFWLVSYYIFNLLLFYLFILCLISGFFWSFCFFNYLKQSFEVWTKWSPAMKFVCLARVV